jgi:hypothetical protein
MNNTLQNKLIFSLDTEQDKASDLALQNTADLVSGEIVDGCYKGKTERSIMTHARRFNQVLDIAKQCNQESVLFVSDFVYLIYLSDRSMVKIGSELKQVDRDFALNQDAYTKIGQDYYIVS